MFLISYMSGLHQHVEVFLYTLRVICEYMQVIKIE